MNEKNEYVNYMVSNIKHIIVCDECGEDFESYIKTRRICNNCLEKEVNEMLMED